MKLEKVKVVFAGKNVLDHFSISLPDKGIVALMAPSGAGKSTLLRVLAGLQASPGAELGDLAGRKLGIVFQEDRLLPWLTALENVMLVLSGDHRQQRALWELSALGLEDAVDLRPDALSGGMKRRVAIARAMAVDPTLLLLDEPFTGLDTDTTAQVAAHLARLKEKALVIVVTHQLSQALAMTEDIRRFTGPPLTEKLTE
jgi:ABC-type nitrate/sulfonate/bicarbonate transport system ATPase subunit